MDGYKPSLSDLATQTPYLFNIYLITRPSEIEPKDHFWLAIVNNRKDKDSNLLSMTKIEKKDLEYIYMYEDNSDYIPLSISQGFMSVDIKYSKEEFFSRIIDNMKNDKLQYGSFGAALEKYKRYKDDPPFYYPYPFEQGGHYYTSQSHMIQRDRVIKFMYN